MAHQEKKYRVTSFDTIESVLAQANVEPTSTKSSTHYYAKQDGLGATKLVAHDDQTFAIHILDEKDGKFTLRENISVKDKESGLQWLRDHGFDAIDVVEMTNTDYEYKGGTIGLYTINSSLMSVVLYYPSSEHVRLEQELGLTEAENITMPYNLYLQKQGQLKVLELK
jgi:adenylate cyclase class IV